MDDKIKHESTDERKANLILIAVAVGSLLVGGVIIMVFLGVVALGMGGLMWLGFPTLAAIFGIGVMVWLGGGSGGAGGDGRGFDGGGE
jgi:hypothetical protein